MNNFIIITIVITIISSSVFPQVLMHSVPGGLISLRSLHPNLPFTFKNNGHFRARWHRLRALPSCISLVFLIGRCERTVRLQSEKESLEHCFN